MPKTKVRGSWVDPGPNCLCFVPVLKDLKRRRGIVQMVIHINFDEHIAKKLRKKTNTGKSPEKNVVVPRGYWTAGLEPEPARGAKATSGKFGG